MYLTILKIAQPLLWSYVNKRAAGFTADYLNRRRQRHLRPAEEVTAASAEKALPAPEIGYSGGDVFWFTLSGVLLGSMLGVMVSRLLGQEE